MANVLDGSKSQLGKLLAAENIRIEHRQVSGPSFDVKNRVLVLPIWKDMSSDLYDLMIGHEVGHALYTPAAGWVEEAKEKGGNFKAFLNLVEDARIEKLMKRRFPGLRKPMYNGYTELVDRNFFGVPMEEMKYFSFIDRLNVHFKLGPRANVSFNEKEQDLIDRIENCETWDQVMNLSRELYDMAADEKSELEDLFDDLLDMLENMDGEMGDGASSEGMESSESYNEATSEQKQKMKDLVQRLRDAGKDNLADALEKGSQQTLNNLRDWLENTDPSSITDEAFKQKEMSLIDEKALPITYVKWPTINPKDWVIPHHITHAIMNFDEGMEQSRHTIYSEFMSVNKRYISYLVKEFELRRNATQLAKAKVSKTGKLDVDKVWKYKLSEDLFLQSTTIPKGKNHGMLMAVDLSSSMTDNIAGTIEQVVSLALFCRKVNIPFDVYGFVDNYNWRTEIALAGITKDLQGRNDAKEGNMALTNEAFRLTQLLTHTMKLSEFNRAVQNLLMLAHVYNRTAGYYYYSSPSQFRIPSNMALGGTPLNETVIVLAEIAKQFKKATRVEVLNTIILTDGEASYGLGAIHEGKMEGMMYGTRYVMEYGQEQVAIRNKYRMTDSLLEMYKKITGSRMIGIYLMAGNNYKSQIHRKMSNETPDYNMGKFEDQYRDEFHKHKFFGLKTPGYDVYYMVPGKELVIKDVTMNDVVKKKDNVTKTNLYNAFKKMQNTKMISRVFLNQFIQHVS